MTDQFRDVESVVRDSDDLLAYYAALDFADLMDADAAAVVALMRDRLIAEIDRLTAEQAAVERVQEWGVRAAPGEHVDRFPSCQDAVNRVKRARERGMELALVTRTVLLGPWEAAS